MSLVQLTEPRCKNDATGREEGGPFVDIVAVHGLDEGPKDAWTEPETNILWLRDLLPESIESGRVLTYGYIESPTSLRSGDAGDKIQRHARALLAYLQANRALEDCSRRPIIFICHGFGGIIVKMALAFGFTRTTPRVEPQYSIFLSTFGILFFGTPHTSTGKGKWVHFSESRFKSLFGLYRKKRRVTTIKNRLINPRHTAEEFSRLMTQFRIFLFWEMLESKLVSRHGIVVDRSSAAPMMYGVESSGIYANHSNMVKLTKNNPSYDTVIEVITRYCREAPRAIAREWHEANF